MRLIATCKLGLESTVAIQLKKMGIDIHDDSKDTVQAPAAPQPAVQEPAAAEAAETAEEAAEEDGNGETPEEE